MEHLHNGFTLELCPGAFPLSTDSVALSGFVSLPKKAAVLDLGSGCGTLGLLLCARFPQCTVTGVELEESAHAMALHNAQVNGLTDRLTSICADLTAIPSLVAPGSYTCCISNPPYFAAGPQSKAHPTARQKYTAPWRMCSAAPAGHCGTAGIFTWCTVRSGLRRLAAAPADTAWRLRRCVCCGTNPMTPSA